MAVVKIDEHRSVEAYILPGSHPTTVFRFRNGGSVQTLILSDEGVEALTKAHKEEKEFREASIKHLLTNGSAA